MTSGGGGDIYDIRRSRVSRAQVLSTTCEFPKSGGSDIYMYTEALLHRNAVTGTAHACMLMTRLPCTEDDPFRK